MVAYSFKSQFVDPIRMGAKCQTIRADRRRHARAGEQLQLYTAMRTKHCRLIARAQCITVSPITLVFGANDRVVVPGITYFAQPALDEFAQRDGFGGWQEMRDFWRLNHGTELFQGVIIYWRDMVPG